MKDAYEEVKLCVKNNKHNLSKETLEMCLDALRTVENIKHNGYTNYATWLAANQVDYNETMYTFLSNLKKEMQDEDEDTAVKVLRQTIEYWFKAEATKFEELANNTIWSSLINHEECQINYYEIAKTFYENN